MLMLFGWGNVCEGDNNLLEYVMLLVSNQRARSHIATDLEAFFGKDEVR
jgi:hypothetical protein